MSLVTTWRWPQATCLVVAAAAAAATALVTRWRSQQASPKTDCPAPSAPQRRRPRVTICGDVFVDVVVLLKDKLPTWGTDTVVEQAIQILAGGSGLNTATHLVGLMRWRTPADAPPDEQQRCVLFSALGRDKMGQVLRDHCTAVGVELKCAEADATGACVVLSGAKDRGFATYPGPIAKLTLSQLDVPALLQSDHVHLAGYFNCPGLWSADTELLLQQAQLRGTTTSLTSQWDESGKWDGGLARILPHLDIVFMSAAEAKEISRLSGEEAQAGWFLDRGVRIVVLTLGQQGAFAMFGHKRVTHREPCLRLDKVVDTTGAGDAFVSGFLFAWGESSKHDGGVAAIHSAMRWGCAAGTACVSQVGASAPMPRERVEACLRPSIPSPPVSPKW